MSGTAIEAQRSTTAAGHSVWLGEEQAAGRDGGAKLDEDGAQVYFDRKAVAGPAAGHQRDGDEADRAAAAVRSGNAFSMPDSRDLSQAPARQVLPIPCRDHRSPARSAA